MMTQQSHHLRPDSGKLLSEFPKIGDPNIVPKNSRITIRTPK